MRCKNCGEDVDELVPVKIGRKTHKLCEDCTEEALEAAEIASEAERLQTQLDQHLAAMDAAVAAEAEVNLEEDDSQEGPPESDTDADVAPSTEPSAGRRRRAPSSSGGKQSSYTAGRSSKRRSTSASSPAETMTSPFSSRLDRLLPKDLPPLRSQKKPSRWKNCFPVPARTSSTTSSRQRERASRSTNRFSPTRTSRPT